MGVPSSAARGPKTALRIDEKDPGGNDGVSLGQAFENLDARARDDCRA